MAAAPAEGPGRLSRPSALASALTGALIRVGTVAELAIMPPSRVALRSETPTQPRHKVQSGRVGGANRCFNGHQAGAVAQEKGRPTFFER